MEDVAVGTASLLFRSSPHSLDSVRALSPRGLFLPSDGSLPAISPVGAGATVVCGLGVSTISAAADLVLSFLPVNSLV